MRELQRATSYFDHCARMPPELCTWLAERAADNEDAFSTAEVMESAEVVFAVWPRPGGFAAIAVSGFDFMMRGGSVWNSWNAMFVRDEVEARALIVGSDDMLRRLFFWDDAEVATPPRTPP